MVLIKVVATQPPPAPHMAKSKKDWCMYEPYLNLKARLWKTFFEEGKAAKMFQRYLVKFPTFSITDGQVVYKL